MKNLVLALLITGTASLKAQTFVSYTSVSGGGTIDSNLNKRDAVQGSTFLFKDWNNSARLFCTDQRIFDVENINFDLKNDNFASMISKDSIFIFDNIFKVKINNRQFVNLKNKFYETMYSSNNNFVFLKEYLLKIEPELHKITNTVIGPGKYNTENKYYIYKDGDIEKLTLNKKHILEIVNSKESLVIKYVKSNRLSFSSEEDIVKIFQFYDSQSNE